MKITKNTMRNGHIYLIVRTEFNIGGSGSERTNTLLNLINEQNDIHKIHLYARDLHEPKYKILIKKVKMQE